MRALVQAARRRTASLRWLPVLVLMALLAGCQCFTRLAVSGSLEQGVVFRAPEGPEPYVGGAVLLNLAVFAVGASDSRPLWQIRGMARTKALTYGVAPVGMSQDGPAAQLERGRTYIVTVEGSSGGLTAGLPCRGKASFAIGPDGAITPCNEMRPLCG